jgi:hypothetical protein
MDSMRHLSIKAVIDSRIDSVLNCVVPKIFTDQKYCLGCQNGLKKQNPIPPKVS